MFHTLPTNLKHEPLTVLIMNCCDEPMAYVLRKFFNFLN